tara:strand:+ start:254 stop:559 length:306 start_codon:yes stop_codon:yes gene_type:complete
MSIKSWLIGRGVSNYLKKTTIKEPGQKQIVKAVKNMVANKKTIKNEPVIIGGVITILVALGGSYGLDLTAEQLSITVSTLIAIVTFITRKFVSPSGKEKSQ